MTLFSFRAAVINFVFIIESFSLYQCKAALKQSVLYEVLKVA